MLEDKINSVKENAKKLEKEKENYDTITSVSTDGEATSANQIDKYELFLVNGGLYYEKRYNEDS